LSSLITVDTEGHVNKCLKANAASLLWALSESTAELKLWQQSECHAIEKYLTNSSFNSDGSKIAK